MLQLKEQLLVGLLLKRKLTRYKMEVEEMLKRDRKKGILCRDKGIKLIRIKYDEPLGVDLIKRKCKNE